MQQKRSHLACFLCDLTEVQAPGLEGDFLFQFDRHQRLQSCLTVKVLQLEQVGLQRSTLPTTCSQDTLPEAVSSFLSVNECSFTHELWLRLNTNRSFTKRILSKHVAHWSASEGPRACKHFWKDSYIGLSVRRMRGSCLNSGHYRHQFPTPAIFTSMSTNKWYPLSSVICSWHTDRLNVAYTCCKSSTELLP